MSTEKPFIAKKGLFVNATSGNVALVIGSNDAIFIPVGNTSERPSVGVNGYLRYNSDLNIFEGYKNGTWSSIGGGINVQTQNTAPSDETLGSQWYDQDDDALYFRISNGTANVWYNPIANLTIPTHYYQNDAPSSALYNDTWFDTNDEILYMRVNDGTSNVWMDIVTSTSLSNNYVRADANQSFTNTQMATARRNINASDIGALAYKNLIINGNMEISQENGNTAANTNGYYPVDQFFMGFAGGHDANTYQSTTAPNNYNYSTAIAVKVANASPNTISYITFQQRIEGTFAKSLKWGTSQAQDLTVGFWSYCTTPITFSSAFFGSLSTTDAAYVKDISISAGNTWQWNSFVVPGPTTGTFYSNTSIGIKWVITLDSGTFWQTSNTENWINTHSLSSDNISNFGALGAGNTFYTTGWVAIPGEHNIPSSSAWLLQPDLTTELLKCKRYYQKAYLFGAQASTTVTICYGNIPEIRSASPSLTLDTFDLESVAETGVSLSVNSGDTYYRRIVVGHNTIGSIGRPAKAVVSLNDRL